MTKIKEFFKRPNVRKWISDVIKIGVGVFLGGVFFCLSVLLILLILRVYYQGIG